jgi:hypothetical protein
MTYAAPTCDFFDDGLVHSHDWARATPPGSHHAESRRNSAKVAHAAKDHDDVASRDTRHLR